MCRERERERERERLRKRAHKSCKIKKSLKELRNLLLCSSRLRKLALQKKLVACPIRPPQVRNSAGRNNLPREEKLEAGQGTLGDGICTLSRLNGTDDGVHVRVWCCSKLFMLHAQTSSIIYIEEPKAPLHTVRFLKMSDRNKNDIFFPINNSKYRVPEQIQDFLPKYS